ncbi:MAG: BspA family leucine-rich repeat surface protein [Carnobacterium maltaromaticum]
MKKIIIIILILLCQSVPVNAVDNSLEILYKDKNSYYSCPTVESLSEKPLEANEPFVDNELSMDSTEPIASIGEDETDKDIATPEKEYESTIKATENSSEEPISDGTERNQNIESYASIFNWGTSTVTVNGDVATVGSGQLSGEYPKELYNVKHLTLASGVKFPDKSNSLFGYTGISEEKLLLEDIKGLERVDTSNVTNMSHMFYYASKLKSLDVSNFKTSNVTDMSYMFYRVESITNLNVSNFKTSNVTDMSNMFYSVESITNLNVSNFKTSNVTNMAYMFYNVNSITNLNVSNFKTSNVTNMAYMFRGMKELIEIKGLEKFDTSKVTKMNNMFATTWAVKSFDLSSFDTRKVSNMSSMFQNNSSIESLKIGKNTKLKDDIKLSVSKGIGYSGNWTLKGSAPGEISLSDKEMGSDKPSNNPGEYVWEEKDKITANPKNQKLFLGQNINEISTYDLVKDVKVGDRDLTTDEYTVSMQNTVPTDTVGDKKAKVLITYKKDPTVVLSLDVPVEILWGNSVVYGGYDYFGDGRTVGAFTLSTGTSPTISAAQGNKDDNKPIHSRYPNQQYYTFDWFDLSDRQSLLMNENDKGSTYIQANGNDLKKDKLKEWGTDQKQAVNYGDIVRAWHDEESKNWLYENEKKQNYNDGKKSVYYEITKTGFQRLGVNQLKMRDDILIDKYTSQTDLDKDIKANPSDYYENPNDYENVNVVGFTKYPDTSKSGTQPATIRFEETLKSGKKVQYDYNIQVNVDDKWVNVTIPTKMLFFSDMKNENKNKVISESYLITNNSDNTSLVVEMASFSVEKDSEVTYLSATEKDPINAENKLRLNLFVNDQSKVQSLNSETQAIKLIDLDFKTSAKLSFEGQYFNAGSEDSPKAKSSMVLKFNIKR